MKYFKTETEIMAIDQGQEFLIQADWKELTEEEMRAELASSPEDAEKQRISQIKAKAGEIISAKYSMIWQINHPRLDSTYAKEYEWIDNIRDISNKAELEGTALEDIDWGIK